VDPTEQREQLKAHKRSIKLSGRASRSRRFGSLAGQGLLLVVTSSSAIAVLFIFYFIFRDAIPFFVLHGFREFFTSSHWFPSGSPPEFGALAIFVGSGLVTFGAVVFAVVLGLPAAVFLSDIVTFKLRQVLKPIIETLAAIPSVAYGFFALVVLAPVLQQNGGTLLAAAAWLLGIPVGGLSAFVVGDLMSGKVGEGNRNAIRAVGFAAVFIPVLVGLFFLGGRLSRVEIESGTNALNVAMILGIMALPTVVSVSEDSLTAIGRDLREGSYALGATRYETIAKVVIPAAKSGLWAAVILGVMRAVGETMVVWMASGNAAQIPHPWFNFLEPVRTLTATIAGDMGEADQVTGSLRYHVLFALALCLLAFSFVSNMVSEWIVRRSRVVKG
jgi:phosphate transport system permease protein